MLGIAAAICATSLLCLVFNTTRLIGLSGLTLVIYFYPLSILPISVLLAGAFFLFNRFY